MTKCPSRSITTKTLPPLSLFFTPLSVFFFRDFSSKRRSKSCSREKKAPTTAKPLFLKQSLMSSMSTSSSFSCRCGLPTVIAISNKPRSRGRRFRSCPKWKLDTSCGYFCWIEEDGSLDLGSHGLRDLEEVCKKIEVLSLCLRDVQRIILLMLLLVFVVVILLMLLGCSMLFRLCLLY